MAQSFDRFPDKRLEQGQQDFFELASRTLRRRLPFISHDPSSPQTTLSVPEATRTLVSTAADELHVAEDAPDVALRLILHFTMRDTKARQSFFESPSWHRLSNMQPLTGIKIIDYGAADGGFVRMLRALGAQAYGIDREDRWLDDPLLVMGKERFHQPTTQDFLAGTDMVISNRLLRVVNRTPDHRRFVDAITQRVLKPGGLLLTTPALYDERLDDTEHYGDRYSQYDYRGGDDGWDYSIARKLK